MHFDPYDNIIVQAMGSKTFKLIDPQLNQLFREGHLREAELEISESDAEILSLLRSQKGFDSLQFRKRKLTESTSMVHSPIQMSSFKKDWQVACTVHEGEALYVPSFFWHEVESEPGLSKRERGYDTDNLYSNYLDAKLTVAVNYWFEPLYKKEFPCSVCRKYRNIAYYDKISSLKDLIR